LEEERRLAYVGLTRARHRALISFAANRQIHGQWLSSIRSRFVDELPAEHTEIIAELGLQPSTNWGDDWATPGHMPPPGRFRPPHAGLRQPLLIENGTVPRRGEEIRKVGGFVVGGRVFHQKFGYGTIISVEDNKLAIHFDVAGEKKVMDAYVVHA